MTVRALSAAVALLCAVAWGADDFYAVREAAEKGDALAQLLIAKAFYGVPDEIRAKAMTFLPRHLLGVLECAESVFG